jgi:hypothetical protein
MNNGSVAVARASPDPVARLSGKFPLSSTLLALPRRQLAARGLENPVMDAVVHHLKRVVFGHAEEIPLD